MSSVKLQGNASGTGAFTVTSPNSNNTQTLTLPDATATLVGDTATQTLTNKTLTSPTITGASMSSMASSVITSGTAVASTSGTSIDFTSIPSWVKRITVMFSGVSTNGTSVLQLQLGTSGGVETSGYSGIMTTSIQGGTTAVQNLSSGIITADAGGSAAASVRQGTATFTLLGSNTWTFTLGFGYSDTTRYSMAFGVKALSGTLDRVRITTVNGTDTFDAGSINILYE